MKWYKNCIKSKCYKNIRLQDIKIKWYKNSIKWYKNYIRLNDTKIKEEKALLAEKEKLDEIAKAKANKQIVKAFKIDQKLKIANVIMNTAGAVMKVQEQWGFPAGIPLAAMYGAMGLKQIDIIKSQKPAKMALGGLVGGRRHSQGGTMIEAEQGEFVMNRTAVQALGVETMNKINRGGSSGGINISFSGNVMSDDFIETEAIPKIKEALRRGGDIGI